MKEITLIIMAIYVGWNGAGRWKLSLFESLFIIAIIGGLVLF